MVSKLVKLHILSHALEHYLKREGASQKDIRQELAVLNEIEKEFLTNTDFNRSLYSNENITVEPADGYYPEELGKWKIGSFEPELALIPGHSPGSTVFIFKDNGFVIGGDVLFKGSVGRSDFSYGSHMTLMAGIEQYLLPLPGNTVVFPGHGEPTTLQDEIASNPFLNGATR